MNKLPVTIEQKAADAIAKTPRPKKVIQASLMSEPEASWVKVLSVAKTGHGKTYAIVGILEAMNRDGKPNKVFVADCDLGGGGLVSVREELKQRGRADLMDNIAWVEFPDYESVQAFIDHPDNVVIGRGAAAQSLWSWDPDVLVFEGFSNFHHKHVFRYATAMDPIRSASKADEMSDARREGVWAEFTDWQTIRKATVDTLDEFLRMHNPNGKRINKYMTCLLDEGKEDKLTGETKKGPLISGASRSQLGPAFDLILNMEAVIRPGSKDVKFQYKCDIAGGTLAKRRGFQVQPVEEADMKALWTRLTA